ncbi:unnamed protein product, partial [Mycena citricolor]
RMCTHSACYFSSLIRICERNKRPEMQYSVSDNIDDVTHPHVALFHFAICNFLRSSTPSPLLGQGDSCSGTRPARIPATCRERSL